MLMSHFEEPKLSDDEEPPTEQDKRKKLVRHKHTHTLRYNFAVTKDIFLSFFLSHKWLH